MNTRSKVRICIYGSKKITYYLNKIITEYPSTHIRERIEGFEGLEGVPPVNLTPVINKPSESKRGLMQCVLTLF